MSVGPVIEDEAGPQSSAASSATSSSCMRDWAADVLIHSGVRTYAGLIATRLQREDFRWPSGPCVAVT